MVIGHNKLLLIISNFLDLTLGNPLCRTTGKAPGVPSMVHIAFVLRGSPWRQCTYLDMHVKLSIHVAACRDECVTN